MGTAVAEAFRDDPRVAAAKRRLLEVLGEYTAGIAGIRAPDPARAVDHAEQVARLGALRGGDLYFPYLGSGIGRGPLVELADGSVKYDLIGGIGVNFFGHSHPRLVAAALDAALQDVVMQGNLQQNAETVELAEVLLRSANASGATLDHVFLTTSGAMANENALKMVFQKHAPADRVLAFEGCFAGRTFALSQLTDRPAYREGLPRGVPVDYVPFYDPDDGPGSIARALRTLTRHLDRHPGRHAAMWFELILGEGGFYPGEAGFFRALMGELRDRGVAVVVDEVQTFGRTQTLFAFQMYGLDDLVDLVAVGKMSQVCATLFRDAYRPRPGLVSQTFTGSTSAIHAGRAVLGLLLESDLFGPAGRNQRLHEHFAQRLAGLAARQSGRIAGPFGVGAMVAFTPGDGSAEGAKSLLRQLFDAGVIAFSAGSAPTRIRFLLPSPVLDPEDVEAVCGILEGVLAGGEAAC